MRKNLLKYLIMTALLVCVIAADSRTLYASGGDKITSGDYTYRRLSDGTAQLVRYKKNARVVEIPSKIDGLKVTVIGKHAFYKSEAKEIHIPEGILTIKKEAFYHCNYIEEINLPESVEYIGPKAFYKCHAVKTITLPKNPKTLYLSAFSYLDFLEEIKMRGESKKYSVVDGILYNKTKTIALYCPKGRKTPVVLDKNVKKLREHFVDFRYALPEVKIPASVREIGESAFEGFHGNIIFYGKSEKMPVIGKDAFFDTGKCARGSKMYVPANQYKAYKKILKDKNIAMFAEVKLMKLAK